MYNPAFYAKVNDKQRRDADDILEEYKDELGQISGRCLDIGSGSCDVVADFVLPKLNPTASVVCSDISEPMMDFGKEKYEDNHRMSFVKLNIEVPDLPEDLIEQFDHVTSFYCLHWCQDMRQVFENIFKLLLPGGTTLLVFPVSSPVRSAYPVLAAMPRYQPYMKDADRYTVVYDSFERPRESTKALLKDVGFKVRHFSQRERSYIFKTPTILIDFLLATNPFVERMPADIGEEYKKDLIKEVEKTQIVFDKNNNNGNEYSILLRYHIFVVHLEKPLVRLV